MLRTCIFLLLFGLHALACSHAEVFPGQFAEAETSPPPEVQCDTCRYPVVMVHGFLASGDTWAPFQQLFTSNGYHPDLIFAFDWNSLNQGANHVALLDAFIDGVLAKTGAPKVRLIGHSAGGGLGYSYLSDPARAAKVDGYVHIGSMTQSGAAGPGGSVATLNIWSPGDKVAQGGDIPGAVNIQWTIKTTIRWLPARPRLQRSGRFFTMNRPARRPLPPRTLFVSGAKHFILVKTPPS